jgi:hypothetical protein
MLGSLEANEVGCSLLSKVSLGPLGQATYLLANKDSVELYLQSLIP